MGVRASYERLSPEQFEQIRKDEQAAHAYFGVGLEDEEFDAWFREMESSGNHLDIQKAWAGLEFLLTGSSNRDGINDPPPPLGNAVMGGTDTEWEAGYGMVRYLTPQEVKDCAHALGQIDEDKLRRRSDPLAFRAEGIYPYEEDWNESHLDGLIFNFRRVREFYSEAAKAGEVVLLSID